MESRGISRMIKYPKQFCIRGGGCLDDGGAFNIPFENRILYVIASHGGGWDHVSVSLQVRNPNWREMCFIKDLFFDPEDCVIQYHPSKSKNINLHPYCLHLWRPQNVVIPMPPMIYV